MKLYRKILFILILSVIGCSSDFSDFESCEFYNKQIDRQIRVIESTWTTLTPELLKEIEELEKSKCDEL